MKVLDCKFDPNQVGMFLWGKVKEAAEGQKCPGEIVSDRVLYQAGVFITPGFIFGKNGEDYIRISLCAKPQVLEEAYDRISAVQAKLL